MAKRSWARVNISLDKDIKQQLEKRKLITGVPVSQQIEKALKKVLG